MEKLLRILSEIRPEVDFQTDAKLIDDGILDSIDIIALVGEINERFDIQIGVENLLPENFNSAHAMMEMIERLQNEN